MSKDPPSSVRILLALNKSSHRVGGFIWRVVLGCVVLAWLAMSVRTLWIEGPREETWVFALVGLGGIVLVTIAGWSMRERRVERPWMTLGAWTLAIGLVALPASPP